MSQENEELTVGASLVSAAGHEEMDRVETRLLGAIRDGNAPAVELPVTHRFTPGLYVREIFMPAGTLLTSRIHKTEHPYVITKGVVSVLIPGTGVETLSAGHVGITLPGTRRLLYIHEDTTWLTFHPNPENEDLEAIEARIIERRELEDGKTTFELYAAELMAALPSPKEEAQ